MSMLQFSQKALALFAYPHVADLSLVKELRHWVDII